MIATALATLALSLSLSASPPGDAPPEPLAQAKKVFDRLPKEFASKENPITEAKVELGRTLYFDPRLSKNHDVSCNSCHDLATFGVDNKKFSEGHRKQLGGRNSPTVYNAGDHVAQFWDGRADTLEAQAKGPITNPVEMAAPSEAHVVATLKSIPGYVKLFRKAFPKEKDPVTFDNVARAIGAFERRLVTPSRFDRYLAGDRKALTAEEKAGLATFLEVGCTTCHNGVAIGGNSFQKLGLVEPYPDESDLGRFDHTKDDEDRMKFRVPTLRNVAKTGPWFHNGSKESLDDVIRTMGKHQLGVVLTDVQVKQLEAFLNSLTGELPKKYLAPPKLPESGPETPKPDPS
ncbi:MAG: cytochrome-c peroxidase [Myxococcales bacterium]